MSEVLRELPPSLLR